jgi:hypothetical protein
MVEASLQIQRSDPSSVAIFPRILVTNWEVTDFVRQQLFSPPLARRHMPATLGATLAVLIPGRNETEWRFPADESAIRRNITEIVECVLAYGMPFANRLHSLPLLARWALDPSTEPDADCTNPALLRAVVLYLSSRSEDAKTILRHAMTVAGGEVDDPAMAPVIRFAHLIGA